MKVERRPADAILPNRRKAIAGDKCSWCGGDATSFKDTISQKEYRISGFCQVCQDKTFTEEG